MQIEIPLDKIAADPPDDEYLVNILASYDRSLRLASDWSSLVT